MIPMHLLAALCLVESNGRNAINFHDRGRVSYGVCQIQARTGLQYGLKHYSELLNLHKNKLLAAKILTSHYRRFGNWDQAIMAYNAGPNKLPLRNWKYLKKVCDVWTQLKLASPGPHAHIVACLTKP